MVALALLMGSCAGLFVGERVAQVVPERQNWNGVKINGDIERIEAQSFELLGYSGYEYKGELLNQTTTEFNLRGDVVSVVSVDDLALDNESYSYTYDSEGRLVGKVVSFGSTSDEHRYTLDEYGCVTVDEIYVDGGELESRVVISYDRAGNDVEHVATNRVGRTTFVQQRLYDDNNQCVEVVYSDGDDQVRSRVTTTYDAEGRKLSVVTYEGRNAMKSRVEYAYVDGEVLCTTYDESGAFVSKTGERRDDEDRIVVATNYDSEGAVIVRSVTSYDAAGRIAEHSTINGVDELVSLKSYEYDENGCLVKFTEDDKQTPSLTVILYTYDEYQNLVKERCYMGKHLVCQYITEYNITYRTAEEPAAEEGVEGSAEGNAASLSEQI